MGWIKNALACCLLIVCSMAHAQVPWQGQFLYQYEGGSVYRVITDHTPIMRWTCLKGDEAGAAGEEKPERIQVTPEVYFVTWTERTGMQVTQVLDFKGMKVYSTVIDGSARYVLRGTLKREK